MAWRSGLDGSRTFCNGAWLDFTGRTLEDELGDGWMDGIQPDELERSASTFRSAFQSRRDFAMEYRLRCADGDYRWVLDSGAPWFTPCDEFAGYVGSCVDIIERKEAEEQYRSIVEATSDELIINDLQCGAVVEANSAACWMHGYSREEFIGLSPTAFIHPDYHSVFGEYLETVKSGGAFEDQAIDVRKDGSTFHVSVKDTPISFHGKPHALGVVQDITERVEAYQLLEQRARERTRELLTVLQVSCNVASTLELEPLLGLILDQLTVVADYKGATIFTRNGDEAAILAYRGPVDQDVALRLRFRLDQVIAIWEPIDHRKPVIIPDVRDDTPEARAFQAAVGDELTTTFGYVRSWMAVPLALKEEVVGILSLSWDEPNYYTSRQANLTLAIANQAAVAIGNARLYQQARELAVLHERQRLARELHDSVSQMLHSMALGARTACILLERDPGQVAEVLDEVVSLAKAGLAEM
jgi:PAS domain S-box-containing protein